MPDAPPLQALLSPASVAVIGASRSRAKVGGMVLSNLVAAGYRGAVHPVNPAAAAAGESLAGLPALASSADLPQGVDLAVVCLPREQALPELSLLASRGVRAAVVLAAGFRETGRQGFLAEQELIGLAEESGMLLLGPNSLGLINTACALNASFAAGYPKAGGVSFFSQSGAMCVSVLDWAMSLGLGFSKFLSLGNKARLNEAQVLRALGDDPDTKVILGYCESVEDGQEFMAAAREVTAKKPVLLLKAGITPAGARAVSAHTGSASGSPAAYRAAFRQAGVIHVEEMSQLFGLAQAFATQPLPAGPGLAVLTNAGGPGILAADACARTGLTLPRPGSATIERLAEALPGFASLYNPVDLLGDAGPERYRAGASILLADPQIHALLALFAPTARSQALASARALIAAAQEQREEGGDKPLAACFLGGAAVRPAREALLAAGIPCFDFPEAAVEALDAMRRQRVWLDQDRLHGQGGPCRALSGQVEGACDAPWPDPCSAPWDDEALAIIAQAKAQGLLEIGGVTALEAAHAAGLPVLTTGLARTSAEAARLAGEIGLPVSLSLALRDGVAAAPLPQSGGGGFSRLDSEEAVRKAFLTLTSRAARLRPEAGVTGCLVQAAAGTPRGGFTLVAGFTRDAQFGPLLSFGMAGIGAELLGEVSYRLAPSLSSANPPLTPEDAREMLREMRFYPLLRGAGGGGAVSLQALERLLLAVARLAGRAPELSGAEFSPVLAGPEGVFVAGARLTLG